MDKKARLTSEIRLSVILFSTNCPFTLLFLFPLHSSKLYNIIPRDVLSNNINMVFKSPFYSPKSHTSYNADACFTVYCMWLLSCCCFFAISLSISTLKLLHFLHCPSPSVFLSLSPSLNITFGFPTFN